MPEKINISEVKSKLWEYLCQLGENETLILYKRGIPIAEIKSLPQIKQKKRPIGLAKGDFQVPSDFNDPLPKDIEDSFYNQDS